MRSENSIRKEFYKVFGIEPISKVKPNYTIIRDISSDILLSLICIINDYSVSDFTTSWQNRTDLKKDILEQVISLAKSKWLKDDAKEVLYFQVKSLWEDNQ